MALALVLGAASTTPARLTTHADCTLADVQGAPRITDLTLHVRAHAPSLDEAAFTDAIAKAATLCPVSNTLRGNATISIDAALAS
jgi:organic hydroperoxide reductase OsmC/OhrA